MINLLNYLLWEWAQCTCCEHGKIWKSKDDRVSKIWCDLYRIILCVLPLCPYTTVQYQSTMSNDIYSHRIRAEFQKMLKYSIPKLHNTIFRLVIDVKCLNLYFMWPFDIDLTFMFSIFFIWFNLSWAFLWKYPIKKEFVLDKLI